MIFGLLLILSSLFLPQGGMIPGPGIPVAAGGGGCSASTISSAPQNVQALAFGSGPTSGSYTTASYTAPSCSHVFVVLTRDDGPSSFASSVTANTGSLSFTNIGPSPGNGQVQNSGQVVAEVWCYFTTAGFTSTISVAQSSTDKGVVTVFYVTGGSGSATNCSDEIGNSNKRIDNGTDQSPDSSVTTAANGSLVVGVATVATANPTVWNSPYGVGYTNVSTTFDGTWERQAIQSKVVTTSGTSEPMAFASIGSTKNWAQITFELKD